MAESSIAVCNRALDLIGHADEIESLEDDTIAARKCKQHFAAARDRILEQRAWKFATYRAPLQELAGVTPAPPWKYAYAYPDKVVVVWDLADGQKKRRTEDRPQFIFESLTDAPERGVIYADVAGAIAICTRRVENVAVWPESFADLVAAELAGRIAMPITKDLNIVEFARGELVRCWSQAGAHDFFQEGGEDELESEFEAARR